MPEITAQQLSSMHVRLEKLLGTIDSSALRQNLVPTLLKELGIATEELQVASEELQTQNERLYEILQESENKQQFYQNLCHQFPEPWIVTDLKGTILEANQAAARLLKVDQAALIGRLLVSFVPIDWRTTFRSELNHIPQLAAGHSWSMCLQSAEGKLLNLNLTTVATQSLEGKKMWIQWFLRRSNLQEQSLFEAVDDMPEAASNKNNSFNRPSQIYHRNESIPLSNQGVWLVKEGLVKLSTLTDENQEILLGLVGPSHFITIGSPFLTTYQATALTETRLIQLPMAEIQACPELKQQMSQQMKARMQQLESLLLIIGQRRVEQRLYLFLRLLKQEVGEPIADGIRIGVRLTHEDLADACCATRVTITRLLGVWQSQDYIKFDEKANLILNQDF